MSDGGSATNGGDLSDSTARGHRRLLFAANITLLYPFLAAGVLYGCWLHAGRILGHKPVAWVDDPAETLGNAWLYVPVSWFVVIGLIPILITSIASNIAYILKRRPSVVQAGIRAMTVTGVWAWYLTWIYTDPHEILKWWMD